MANHESEEETARQLLAPLVSSPTSASTVDIRRAVATGRRRVRTRRLAGVGAVAVVAGFAIAGVPATMDLAGRATEPAPPPAATQPSYPDGPASPTPAALPVCVVDRLPVPDDAFQSLVTGGDPSGRFLLGRSYHHTGRDGSNLISGIRVEQVIWDHGELTVLDLPGWDGMLIDINSHGVAIGTSFPASDSLVQTGWVYADGELGELAGGVPRAINERGAVAGSREPVEFHYRPVVWRSPDADPEELSIPGSSWSVEAVGVDVDGTVVGAGHDRDQVTGPPASAFVWWPDGTRQDLPVPPGTDGFMPTHIRDGVVTGRADYRQSQDLARFPVVQYDLATGEFTELSGDGMLHAFEWTATGWLAGTSLASETGLGLWHHSTGVLPLPVRLPGVEDLPEEDLTSSIASVSDDGRVLGGQLSSGRAVPADGGQTMGVDDAASWRCE